MNFLKKYGAMVTTMVAGAGSMIAGFASAQATTLDDVVTNGVSSITTAYTTSLIANLPTVITAVVSIGLVFVLIKLALRWVRRSVH